MNKNSYSLGGRGFTLIELLIVVAIIAILAAIAVPNFLEAQTRAKVSRSLADIRTMRTALEAYAVDNNKYPVTDVGIQANFVGTVTSAVPTNPQFQLDPVGPGQFRSILGLTSPIAYISSFPQSPWKENYGAGAGDVKIAQAFKSYLYVRRDVSPIETVSAVVSGAGEDYVADRRAYLFSGGLVGANDLGGGAWLIKSSGPDAVDNRSTQGLDARVYNSTNGTVSAGDLVVISDRQEI